jgi:hypothetical protein
LARAAPVTGGRPGRSPLSSSAQSEPEGSRMLWMPLGETLFLEGL